MTGTGAGLRLVIRGTPRQWRSPDEVKRNPGSWALLDARGALFGADPGDDVGSILAIEGRHRLHVSELPVMLVYPQGNGAIECQVGMVGRFVDAVDQWRSLVSATCLGTVTLEAVVVEEFTPVRRVGGEIRPRDAELDLGRCRGRWLRADNGRHGLAAGFRCFAAADQQCARNRDRDEQTGKARLRNLSGVSLHAVLMQDTRLVARQCDTRLP